jgi:hypothetical protein
LPNADPALDPSHQVIVRTEQDGSFLLRDGHMYDLERSESTQKVKGRKDLAQTTLGLPEVTLGAPWEVDSGRFVVPTGVLVRDGQPGSAPDPNRAPIDQPNPFDAASAKIQALAQKAQNSGTAGVRPRERVRVAVETPNDEQDRLRQERERRSQEAAQPAGNVVMRNLLQAQQLSRQQANRQRNRGRERDR